MVAVLTCGAASLGFGWLVPWFPGIPRGSLHDLALFWHDPLSASSGTGRCLAGTMRRLGSVHAMGEGQ